MSFKKHIICLLLLLPVFGFANATFASVNSIKHESQAKFSTGIMHELAFLQPESIHTFTANSKNGPVFTAKCADNFLPLLRQIVAKSSFSIIPTPYSCGASNIARLLFPFHFFW